MSGITEPGDERGSSGLKGHGQVRRALKAYPPDWRRRHGEALIGTLLDAAEAEGRDHVTRFELADLVAHGLIHRLRQARDTTIGRLLGGCALVFGGALALASLILGEILPQYSSNARWLDGEAAREQAAGIGAAFGPFPTTGPVLYLVWVALVLTALLRNVSATRQLALLSMVLAPVLLLSGSVGLNRPPLIILLALGLFPALVALAPWKPRTATVSAVSALGLATVVVLAKLPSTLSPHGQGMFVANSWYKSFNHLSHSGGLGATALLTPAVVALALFTVLLAIAIAKIGPAHIRHPG